MYEIHRHAAGQACDDEGGEYGKADSHSAGSGDKEKALQDST
jgi:hypothetical protein